jgi:UDP-glucuronate 4-epimerase
MEEIMPEERFLVTGGTGCIGSWVVRNLVKQGVPVVVLTVDDQFQRLKLILSDAEFGQVQFFKGDVSNVDVLVELAKSHGINRVVHLAGLQLPFCKSNPSLGAAVNVVGTVNIFEMARRSGIERVVYASSAAVFGPKAHYAEEVLPEDADFFPTSHYGAFKIANEQNAKVYWQDNGIASIGLRPHSVYGPGRDQGMTSKPTVAIIAAAVGRKFHIDFGGRYQFQYADDVARAFIQAARVPFQGAAVFNVGGAVCGVDEIVQAIIDLDPRAADLISYNEQPLALPSAFANGGLISTLGGYAETPLHDGIAQTLACYQEAASRGLLDEAYLNKVLG